MHNASINYFNEIESVCVLLEGSAKEFNTLLGAFSFSGLDAACSSQKQIQDKVRAARRSVESVLYTDFITPIEREDIICIMSAMEGVADGISDALFEMRVWGIGRSRGEAIEFSDTVHRCLVKIKRLSVGLEKFRKNQNIIKPVRDASDMARSGERLYTEAMSALIKGSSSTNELVAWSRIYSRLDELLSKCAALADAFGLAIIKNI